jgi:hypothetical protein
MIHNPGEFVYTSPNAGGHPGVYYPDHPYTNYQKQGVAYKTTNANELGRPKPLSQGPILNSELFMRPESFYDRQFSANTIAAGMDEPRVCNAHTIAKTGIAGQSCSCPEPSFAPYISPPQGMDSQGRAMMMKSLANATASSSMQCQVPKIGNVSTINSMMSKDKMDAVSNQFLVSGYAAKDRRAQHGDVADSQYVDPKKIMGYQADIATTKLSNNFYRQAGIGGTSSESHVGPINQHGYITNSEVMNILASEDAQTMGNKLDYRSGQGMLFNGDRAMFEANRKMQQDYGSMAREDSQAAAEALASGYIAGASIVPTFGMVQQGFLRLGVQRNGQLMDKPMYRNNPAALKVQNNLPFNREQKIPYTSGERLNYPPKAVLSTEFDSMVASNCDN